MMTQSQWIENLCVVKGFEVVLQIEVHVSTGKGQSESVQASLIDYAF